MKKKLDLNKSMRNQRVNHDFYQRIKNEYKMHEIICSATTKTGAAGHWTVWEG